MYSVLFCCWCTTKNILNVYFLSVLLYTQYAYDYTVYTNTDVRRLYGYEYKVALC